MVAAFKSTSAEEETISTEDESWSDTSKLEMMALQCTIFVVLLFCKCWNLVCSLCLWGYVPFFSHLWSICYNQWFTWRGQVSRNSNKARSVVSFFCKSSFGTQKSLEQHNLVVIKDCPTCWQSTYNMIARLLQLKNWVCQIVKDRIGLLNLYWMAKICIIFTNMKRLFSPFFPPENYREEQWNVNNYFFIFWCASIFFGLIALLPLFSQLKSNEMYEM